MHVMCKEGHFPIQTLTTTCMELFLRHSMCKEGHFPIQTLTTTLTRGKPTLAYKEQMQNKGIGRMDRPPTPSIARALFVSQVVVINTLLDNLPLGTMLYPRQIRLLSCPSSYDQGNPRVMPNWEPENRLKAFFGPTASNAAQKVCRAVVMRGNERGLP
jgi:hypothetical protein